MSKPSFTFPGPVALRQSPWFDLGRLAELRDRHQQVLERSRAAQAAVKECARTLGMLKSTAGTHPGAVEVLNGPVEALFHLTMDELRTLQISPQDVQNIHARAKQLERLTAEAEILRECVKASVHYQSQLEAFAKARNL